MNAFTDRETYRKVLDLVKEMIKSPDLDDMIRKINTTVKAHMADTFIYAALWDKYEEEIEFFPSYDFQGKEDIKKFFHFYFKNEIPRFQGNFNKSAYQGSLNFIKDYNLFWDMTKLEKGVRGAVMAISTSNRFEEMTSLISETILPQFWSIFSERYMKMVAGKESEMLWKIKDAQADPTEHFLNNIELNRLLESLLELALRKTKLKCGCILLLNEQTGELEFEPRAVKGKSLSIVPEKLSKNQKSIASIVIKTNDYYICNDTENDPNYYPLFQGIKSSLVVPIEFQKRSIGVIALESEIKDQFIPDDAAIILSLAKEATMFIRRAQLFEETSKRGDGIMILGRSEQWKEVEKRIEKASRTDATVILRGESGTGKELLAHAIHFNSPRKNGPFVTLNCAAIPSELLESEMFGHVKGSFTGAYFNKTGEFEKAEGGTIFLDEIGDLPLMLQVKLLRTLQNGEIRPVGSNKVARKVDVRVIAATSRDLESMVATGQFRMDMYYRLHVVPIKVPPLREYREDIPALIENFIKDANGTFKTDVLNIENEALKALMKYDFPGNVRQLRNFIHQAVIMADGPVITVNNLPDEIFRTENYTPIEKQRFDFDTDKEIKSYHEEKELVLERFTKSYFSSLLQSTSGNMMKSAKVAGISRVSLYKILNRYGIGHG